VDFDKKTEKIQIILLKLYICCMEITQSIQQYASYPIPHHLMTWLLREYSQPNDKIHYLIKDGILQPVKRGLYVAGPQITSSKPDPFLLANHILGPSYVSLESALSYHGLIPEKVYEISSVTIKANRRLSTPLGVYSYTRIPLPYYSYGIRSVEADNQQRFLIASPEKALFDKIITTAGVEFRSKTSVLTYIENDLRMDIDALKKLDVSSMESWIPTSPKKGSLSMLTETIRQQ
jgi:predicted transcriptional regulator of viral defense system